MASTNREILDMSPHCPVDCDGSSAKPSRSASTARKYGILFLRRTPWAAVGGERPNLRRVLLGDGAGLVERVAPAFARHAGGLEEGQHPGDGRGERGRVAEFAGEIAEVGGQFFPFLPLPGGRPFRRGVVGAG